jgi:hypothetical protein
MRMRPDIYLAGDVSKEARRVNGIFRVRSMNRRPKQKELQRFTLKLFDENESA